MRIPNQRLGIIRTMAAASIALAGIQGGLQPQSHMMKCKIACDCCKNSGNPYCCTWCYFCLPVVAPADVGIFEF